MVGVILLDPWGQVGALALLGGEFMALLAVMWTCVECEEER